jgi:ABC-2 type transport system permease protein
MAAIVIAAISLNAVIGRTALRLDITAERLHSLSRETRDLIGELPEDRPVFIQAFISPEVPESLVQVRANLLGTLREINAIAGAKAQVLIEDTEPFTDVARDAREKFGIVPREIPNLRSARFGFSQVFMGIAVTCGAEEQVLPFLDRGLSPEYEITRSMRVVAKTARKKIGLVNTEAKIFGGFDFQTMRSNPPWPVVDELKKQYEVVQVAPDNPITEDLDGLMVALPSSLSQEEMDNVIQYMEAGHPTLLLIDPLPVVNIGLAPAERAGANMNPFMRNQAPPPKEQGNIQQFLTRLGIRWDSTHIIWDNYNPHPDLAHLPPEVVFVGQGNQNENAFNLDHTASAGLQEMVFLYPGTLDKAAGTNNEFSPLLRSGADSGNFSYFQVVQRTFLGVQLNRNLPHRPDGQDYIIAAHVKSTTGEEPDETSPEENGHSASGQEESDTQAADPQEPAGEQSPSINAIVIADLDFISEQFFQIRASGPENLNFDNVTFFLNCIDVLVEDESFVALRSKRVRHRTLERVEEQTSNFIDERVAKEQDAEAEAEQALADAQRRLDDKVNEVRQRPDLDDQTKQIMARNLQEVEQRRFEVLKSNIEAEKQAKLSESKESMEEQIRRIQSNIKTAAVLLPPIPVFVIGVLIFVRRQRREREGAAAARRLRA